MTMEKFHYQPKKAGSKEIVLPHFKNLPFGLVRRVRKLDEVEQMCQIVEEICDEKTLALLDQLDIEEWNEFVEKWQGGSEVSAGESLAS